MMLETSTAPAERATVSQFGDFTEVELRMALDAVRAAITAFNLTACLSNHMKLHAAEDFADDREASLIADLEAIEVELVARGISAEGSANG